MHGISLEMVKKQIEALGLDWMPIYLPKTDSMERYNEIIGAAIDELKKQGYTHAAFGDIFLEDLRLYREKQLEKAGIKGCLSSMEARHVWACKQIHGIRI